MEVNAQSQKKNHNDFVNDMSLVYIYDNAMILSGLDWKSSEEQIIVLCDLLF